MTDIAKLKELRERVIAATGPDRELEILIAAATGYTNRFTGQLMSDFMENSVHAEEVWLWEGVPNYTASIDAALALVERMLPGMRWGVQSVPHRQMFSAVVWDEVRDCRGEGESAPLAVLAAFLSALISQAERAGE